MMKIEELYSFNQQLKSEGILYCYSGMFTQGIIEETGEILMRKIEKDSNDINVTQKVVTIFIEQVQNILIHSEEKYYDENDEKEYPSGIVTIGYQENAYYILCGNIIKNEVKNSIAEKIDKMNSLDKNELKNLYKEKLKSSEPMSKKGAGLGLIEIARRCSSPIEYNFTDLNSTQTYYAIKVSVNKNDLK